MQQIKYSLLILMLAVLTSGCSDDDSSSEPAPPPVEEPSEPSEPTEPTEPVEPIDPEPIELPELPGKLPPPGSVGNLCGQDVLVSRSGTDYFTWTMGSSGTVRGGEAGNPCQDPGDGYLVDYDPNSDVLRQVNDVTHYNRGSDDYFISLTKSTWLDESDAGFTTNGDSFFRIYSNSEKMNEHPGDCMSNWFSNAEGGKKSTEYNYDTGTYTHYYQDFLYITRIDGKCSIVWGEKIEQDSPGWQWSDDHYATQKGYASLVAIEAFN